MLGNPYFSHGCLGILNFLLGSGESATPYLFSIEDSDGGVAGRVGKVAGLARAVKVMAVAGPEFVETAIVCRTWLAPTIQLSVWIRRHGVAPTIGF